MVDISIDRLELLKSSFEGKRIAIIGDGNMASRLADEFSSRPTLGSRVVARFTGFDQASSVVARVARQIS